MGGGTETASSLNLPQEEESLLDHNHDNLLELSSQNSETEGYKPGALIEAVAGLKVSHYDVPKTMTLMLVGPRGSGKSSLVNRILRAFDKDKFVPDSAQVSYNSFVGEGTYFLQEYMVPRGSTSFCLYDTRSLSENYSDNFETLRSWMTAGVRHGQLVIRNSDASSVRKNMKCKARHAGYCSREKRMVNFVIFVVNGLSVLKSIDDKDNRQYTDLLAKLYSCPYLSFKDDKPVVVITHGDLLSHTDRARIRIHLGELLGIPPDTQIFDIPDKCEPATELAVVDMLRYSLKHADRNLPFKVWPRKKVLRALIMIYLVCAWFLSIWGFIRCFKDNIDWHAIWHFCWSSKSNTTSGAGWSSEINTISDAILQEKLKSEGHINWHTIRHLWYE